MSGYLFHLTVSPVLRTMYNPLKPEGEDKALTEQRVQDQKGGGGRQRDHRLGVSVKKHRIPFPVHSFEFGQSLLHYPGQTPRERDY